MSALEQEVVEDFSPDHESGQEVLSARTRQVDVDERVVRASEGDGMDLGSGEISDLVEEVELAEDGDGFTRKRITTDLVAWEDLFVDEADGETGAPSIQGGYCAGRSSADDNKIVRRVQHRSLRYQKHQSSTQRSHRGSRVGANLLVARGGFESGIFR